MRTRSSFVFLLSLALLTPAFNLKADDETPTETPAASDPSGAVASPSPEIEKSSTDLKPATKKTVRRVEKADAFIAPPDWEFDGFVAGGQDQEIRSLYYLNDLVYVNVGTEAGFATGDRISIFKRGNRVRDPQTGKFLGYEVRRAATCQVTDRVDKSNCSLRILQANEAVEIGDLVRRAD